MALASVDNLIADIRAGKMVILMDDEDRENEGDLVLAGAHCTLNKSTLWLVTHGWFDLSHVDGGALQAARTPPMVVENTERHKTAFTVSIEAAEGVTTGLVHPTERGPFKRQLLQMLSLLTWCSLGHTLGTSARGGVLMRAGHTEADAICARLAGLEPAAVICEIMNDDGSMARRPELEALPSGTVFNRDHRRFDQYRVTTETTTKWCVRSRSKQNSDHYVCSCSKIRFRGRICALSKVIHRLNAHAWCESMCLILFEICASIVARTRKLAIATGPKDDCRRR